MFCLILYDFKINDTVCKLLLLYSFPFTVVLTNHSCAQQRDKEMLSHSPELRGSTH